MDKQRLQELAGMQLNEIISSSANSKIDKLVDSLAYELVQEGKRLAIEVYDKEGAGKSGAKSKKEYVETALKNFLDKEYQNAIMDRIVEEYNDIIG